MYKIFYFKLINIVFKPPKHCKNFQLSESNDDDDNDNGVLLTTATMSSQSSQTKTTILKTTTTTQQQPFTLISSASSLFSQQPKERQETQQRQKQIIKNEYADEPRHRISSSPIYRPLISQNKFGQSEAHTLPSNPLPPSTIGPPSTGYGRDIYYQPRNLHSFLKDAEKGIKFLKKF